MTQDCEKCKGEGEIECCECGNFKDCPECDGDGFVKCCISDFTIPKHWESADELEEIKEDAERCIADHAKLLALNPRAKESYDRQLSETLAKLNKAALELEP